MMASRRIAPVPEVERLRIEQSVWTRANGGRSRKGRPSGDFRLVFVFAETGS
jgi:hypothetical protein